MGTGGSRFGAGRPAYRLKAEATKRIDIRRWHSGGYLKVGRAFNWTWTCDGVPTGNINVVAEAGAVRLIYSIQNHADQRRDASQVITVTATPCHYGGSRPWFACPICRDRAAVLYLRAGRFACRHCNRIAYQSQSGTMHDRVCNLYHRLADTLEDGKPKWQRWATFNRLEDRFDRVSRQFDASLVNQIAALGFKGIV
jgi:hypothetical protein